MKKPTIDKDDRRDLAAYFSGAAFARLAADADGFGGLPRARAR
jgi:hypothetical protein